MTGTLEQRLAGGTAFNMELMPRQVADALASGRPGTISLQQGRQKAFFSVEVIRTDTHYILKTSQAGFPQRIEIPRDENTETAFEAPARYVTTPVYDCGDYKVQIIRAGKGDELIMKAKVRA